jgi:hypothetical protein
MKKIISLLFLIAILTSCSKNENNTVETIDDGAFQYKVNGNLITINGANVSSSEYSVFFKQLQGTIIPQTRYMFNGQKGNNNVWVFGIKTDSLKIQSYSFDSTYLSISSIPTTMTYNGLQSGLLYNGDNLKINITSYSNGLISGTFTGKFTPFPASGLPNYSTRGNTIISEGEFKNIKCNY